MTYEEYMQELAENDRKISAEHLTDEEQEKEYADFITANKCKTKKVKNG